MTDLSAAGISFLKVRGSYAEVGNAPQRFITGVNIPLATGGVISSSTYAPAVNLTPERTKSFEVGLNAKFLGNKIWLDATYYNTNTYNQALRVRRTAQHGLQEGLYQRRQDQQLGHRGRGRLQEPVGRVRMVHERQFLDEPQQDQGGWFPKARATYRATWWISTR